MTDQTERQAEPTTYELLGRISWGVFVGAALIGVLLGLFLPALASRSRQVDGATPNTDAVAVIIFTSFLGAFVVLARRHLPPLLAAARQVFVQVRLADMLALTALLIPLTYLWNVFQAVVLKAQAPGPVPILSIFGGSSDPLDQALGLTALVLLAPLAEELLFRGFVFRKLMKVVPLWAALALSSALFTAGHSADMGNPLTIFLWGAVMAWLFYLTGNLWVTVTLHFLNNVMAAALPPFMERVITERTTVPAILALTLIAGVSAAHLIRHRQRVFASPR